MLQIVVDIMEQACYDHSDQVGEFGAILAQQPLKGSLFWFIPQHLISTLCLMSKLSQSFLEETGVK